MRRADLWLPDSSKLVIAVAASVVSVALGWFSISRFAKKKQPSHQPDKVPEGPSFNDNLAAIREKRGKKSAIEFAKKHGLFYIVKSPLSWLVPDQYVSHHPNLTKQLLIKQGNNYHEPFTYGRYEAFAEAAKLTFAKSIITMTKQEWRWRKDTLLQNFHNAKLLNDQRKLFEKVVQVGVELREAVLSAAKNGHVLKMEILFTKAAMDVFTFLTFGRSVAFDANVSMKYTEAMTEHFIWHLSTFPPFLKWLPFGDAAKQRQENANRQLWFDSIILPELQIMMQEVDGKVPKAVDRSPGSLLEHMLLNPNFRKLRTKDLVEEIRGILFAGFDTTSHSLSVAVGFMAMSKYRPVVDKLREQVKNALRLTADGHGNSNPTRETLTKTPEVKGFFLETMRLLPVVQGTFGYAYKDINISYEGKNYCIPKGSTVVTSSATNQIHPDYVHGSGDPFSIEPERWLVEPAKQPFLLVFNVGAHACLGKNLALLEGHVFLLMLLSLDVDWHFAFEGMKDGVQPAEILINEMAIARPEQDMPVRVTPR